MKLGVVTRSFPKWTNADTARRMRELGCVCTELCMVQSDSEYWAYNGRGPVEELTQARFLEIVETYRREGIEVTSLGVFTNLMEPDDAEREKNLQYFEAHIRLAAAAGIPFVSTECGFIPGSRGVLQHEYELRFNREKDCLARLCAYAEPMGVSVALEPCVLDVVPSAKRMADLIEQTGAPNLKVLLDPANLIANSSEEDMFFYLADHVAYFHGKDRHVNDTMGRVVGDGDIDWYQFLALYHTHCEGTPFILEYTNPDNTEEILNRVREFDTAAQKMV